MNIRPIGNRILVEEIKQNTAEQQTASGIILPSSAEGESPKEGRVIALGEGRNGANGEFVPFPYTEGTSILFTSGYTTQKIKIENKDYFVITDGDVIGIIE